jgi:hypothetical protein
MLEGTKHEKAVIVILTYIIGFTSGFIAFGVDGYQNDTNLHMLSQNEVQSVPFYDEMEQDQLLVGSGEENSGQPYDAIQNTDQVPLAEVQSETDGELVPMSRPIMYESGQLRVLTKEGPMVLSVHIDQLGETIPSELAFQGHHIEPPVYLPSPKGDYVYFCEQHLGTSNCTNLLFDKEALTIQYLQTDNKKLTTTKEQAASAYWAADGLHIGEFISESLSTPWRLIRKSN